MLKSGVPKKDINLFVTSIIVCGSGLLILVDAFFIHLDAQNALLFIFLPAYQSVASVAGGLIGMILYVRSKSAQPNA
jgi:hypothetical protein